MSAKRVFRTAFLFTAACLAATALSAAGAGAAGQARTYEIVSPVLTASDDMEELLSGGSLHFGSRHLDLGAARPDHPEDPQKQLVCIRFAGLQIPRGARILSVYIQFTSYRPVSSSDFFDVTVAVEDTADSAPLPEEEAADGAHHGLSLCSAAGGIRWASDKEHRMTWHVENVTSRSFSISMYLSGDNTLIDQYTILKEDSY